MVETMRRSYFGAFVASAALALLCVLAASGAAATGITTLVSVDSSGNQGNNNSFVPSVSDDGRYVAFTSHATNLVPGDTNSANDVFVRDLQTGTTQRASVDSSENQANNQSGRPYISSDGRYVTFYSDASNLVTDDTNGVVDAFVRDLQEGTTQRVSLTNSGTQANSYSYDPYISSDGRYVTFYSFATNLVSSDTNGSIDVFVRDLQQETTQRVSLTDSEEQADGDSYNPTVSDDGRYVAFRSDATNLDPSDTNFFTDVFVRDLQEGTTQRVSEDSNGNQANGQSFVAAISEDGNHVLFDSFASNLVQDDTNGDTDAFVHDLLTGETRRVGVGDSENEANLDTHGTDISYDGRYVVFTSSAFNLIPDDTNSGQDVFVRDVQAGTTERVSVSSCGTQANGDFFGPPTISDDGRYVAFPSQASNLVAGDTNGFQDAFVHDRLPGPESQTPDCSAPSVSTATPTGKDVARRTNAKATFSERVNRDSVNASTLKLFKCTSTTSTDCATQITNVTITLSTDGLRAILNPFGSTTTQLAKNTKYKVVVTTGVTDEAGNHLDQKATTSGNQNKVWYFITGLT